MNRPGNAFIILTPAFAAHEKDNWLPAQEHFVRAVNRNFPGLKVIILTFHYPVQVEPRYKWFGNEVVTFGGAMKGKLNSLLRWKNVWSELKHLHAANRVVGIFSFFCSECAFVGHYFAQRHKLLHRIWVLGQDARKANKQVRRIRPAADELVCISDFLVREFQRNHRIRPAHMIPIGIDTLLFPEPALSRTIDILGAGSFIPLKQYDVFIAVVKQVTAYIPHIRAVICGEGPEEEKLRAIVHASGLQDQIVFAGTQPHTDLLKTMQRSKMLLHTSSYEGFGAVCIEALYAGAHVISFCKPMDAVIPHWHIVQTAEEMTEKALELLQVPGLNSSAILPYEINDVAVKLLSLFGYKP